jgi:hypothetical protein
MTEPSIKLPARAEALLSELPLFEPDFDAQFAAIQAALARAPEPGDAALDVLAVPDLAAVTGEPGPSSSVRASSGSLAELARRSVSKSEADTHGVLQELRVSTAHYRRPDQQMVERVRAAGKSATQTPLPGEEEEAPRASGVALRAKPDDAHTPPAQRSARSRQWALAAGGALALAAGAALLLRGGESTTFAPVAPAPEVEQPLSAAQRDEPQHASLPQAPANAQGELAVSPESLAEAPAPARTPRAPAGGAQAARPRTAVAQGPARAPSGASSIVLDEERSVPPAPNTSPEAAVDEPPLAPAHATTADMPLQPSAGAVSAALGGVRPRAQACLAGHSGAATAVVTFASNGTVARVSATGPAAACIQEALSKARIQPFARDTFSATTTIRPP